MTVQRKILPGPPIWIERAARIATDNLSQWPRTMVNMNTNERETSMSRFEVEISEPGVGSMTFTITVNGDADMARDIILAAHPAARILRVVPA